MVKLVKFAKIHGLGVLQRLYNFEMNAFRDFSQSVSDLRIAVIW